LIVGNFDKEGKADIFKSFDRKESYGVGHEDLKERNSKLESRISHMEEHIDCQEDTIVELKKQIGGLEAENHTLKILKENLDVKVGGFSQQKEDFVRDINELEKQNKALAVENKALAVENKALAVENKALAGHIEALQNRVRELEGAQTGFADRHFVRAKRSLSDPEDRPTSRPRLAGDEHVGSVHRRERNNLDTITWGSLIKEEPQRP